MKRSHNEVEVDCPRCKGTLTAIADSETGDELQHTLPVCASYEMVKTIDDATALLTEARETRQRELGLPVTILGGDA